VRVRDDIRPGLLTLHIGRRRGRHFILFRVSDDDQADPSIEVHLPEPNGE